MNNRNHHSAFRIHAPSFLKPAMALLAGAFMGASNLHAAVINHVDFETVYTGGVLPSASDPKWTQSGVAGTPDAETGIYTVSTSGATTSFSHINWDMDESTGATVEFRARVEAQTGTRSANTVVLYTGNKVFVFNLSADRIYFGNSVEEESSYELDMGDFHVIRVTLSDSDDGSVANVYVNNEVAPVISNYIGAANTTASNIRWGNPVSNNGVNGTVEWQYMAYTTSGAYAPIPEPTTALLMGVGVAALGWKLKKRTARK